MLLLVNGVRLTVCRRHARLPSAAFEQLLKHADIALDQAKARGRNGIQFRDSMMSAAVTERPYMERALLQALDADAFQVGYQPLVSLPTIPVAVNVSPLQEEITESTLMGHSADQFAALEALRMSGVRVSIDDFGTGYSRLSYRALSARQCRELPLQLARQRPVTDTLRLRIQRWMQPQRVQAVRQLR